MKDVYYTLVHFSSWRPAGNLFYNRAVKQAARLSPILRICLLVGAGLLLLLTCACAESPTDRAWVYADLRALGTLDAPTPDTDLLAVYTRTTSLSVDIRVDLLDINPGDKFALKIVLWDDRDFSQNPLTIDLSNAGRIQTSGIRAGQPAILPRLVVDPYLDTITVYLNRTFIGDRYHLDVSSYTSDPTLLADEIQNVRSDAQPPAERAPVLLAFWDDFPVTTPAQALRRWDGAHTGPRGGRHGLTNILNAVIHTGVPVALLDIKNPASLAALNFMGNVLELQDLNAHGLLILPDVAFGEPADIALDINRRAGLGFGLPVSQFLYSSSNAASAGTPMTRSGPVSIPGYHARFVQLSDSTHLASSATTRLIPLPSPAAVEATTDGPALDVRRSLFRTAISSDPTDLVVLGGSLPHSTWGDLDMAGPSFEWIAAHPWIQPLSGQDLLTFPVKSKVSPGKSVIPDNSWLEELQSAPQNNITQSAWQTYLTLTASSPDAALQSLRNAYLGQVGEMLAAAQWAEKPVPQVDCMQDLNGDGQPECILANQEYFAVLEPAGARLTLFFYFDSNGPHQLVGPSSQFAVGLSDPSEWHPEKGEAADPSVIPGAFTDDTAPWAAYTPAFFVNGISFTNPDTRATKTFQLVENGIQVVYDFHSPVSTRIPLALDPQAFYSGPTEYRSKLTSHAWAWSQTGGIGVEVSTDGLLSAVSFTSAIPYLALQEDPNLDYPQGNYLPFPLSVVTIQGGGNFNIQIMHK